MSRGKVVGGVRITFLHICGFYEFLKLALGFGKEFVGRFGVACEDVVGRGDGFVGVDGAEADGLVEAVEHGGVGLC